MNLVGTTLLGALAGLVVGMVAAVNLVIFAGVGDGYQTSLGAVLDESPVVGVLVLILWTVSPIVGAVLARRGRGGRSPSGGAKDL